MTAQERVNLACGNPTQKYSGQCSVSAFVSEFQAGKVLGFRGYAPPHPVLKTSLDAAFAKSVCKILSRWDLAERLST